LKVQQPFYWRAATKTVERWRLNRAAELRIHAQGVSSIYHCYNNKNVAS